MDNPSSLQLSGDFAQTVNPAVAYIAGLSSPRSRRVQRQALDGIVAILTNGAMTAAEFPWHQLRYTHVAAVRSILMDRYQPATVNRLLSALRRTLKEAWRLGYLTAEEYQRAADVANIKSETLPAGRSLSKSEIASLLRVCAADGSAAGVRDAAMILLLYGAGLRRAEIVGLLIEDYTAETAQLVVRGKGRKERLTFVQQGVAQAISAWLMLRGMESGPLFCPINKGKRIVQTPMTAQAVYNLLRKRALQAGIKEISPHDFRRTFVSNLLDAGADIATVAKMAGHANVQTTARYDRRPDEAKRRAADLLDIPSSDDE